VICVIPEHFWFPIRQEVWTPLAIDSPAKPRGQGPSYQVVARLKPDVSLREARAQVATIASQLATDFPATNRGIGADVMPYSKAIFGPEVRTAVYHAGAASACCSSPA
jgi:hypothetical protein